MNTIGQSLHHGPAFLGSTYEDLIDYRRSVLEALHRLEVIVRGMEYFGAKPGSPKEECLRSVASCRLYIGIFAMRYGSLDHETGKSITHLEFDEACRLKLPSLIYLLDEKKQPVLHGFVDSGENAERLKLLKAELRRKFVVNFFTTPDDLAKRVTQDVPPLLIKLAQASPLNEQSEAPLSEQAISILRQFASSGEVDLIYINGSGGEFTLQLGNAALVEVTEPRFIGDDLENLLAREMITVKHNSQGIPIYRLTRNGIRQIQALESHQQLNHNDNNVLGVVAVHREMQKRELFGLIHSMLAEMRQTSDEKFAEWCRLSIPKIAGACA